SKTKRAKNLSRNFRNRQDHFVSVKQLLYPQTLYRQQQKTKKMTFFFQVDFAHSSVRNRHLLAPSGTRKHTAGNARTGIVKDRPAFRKAGEFHPTTSTQFVTLRFHISSMRGMPTLPAVPVNLSRPKYPRKPPASR
ncbi:MAG: hypothetical protein LKI57_00790, partial [Acetobacter lovaniensis]|nr:hypothetical protein [Acetobacter lovaniensis]